MLVLSNFEMDTSEKKFFAARIYPISRDTNKTWFIKYKELDYITGVPKSHKYYGALNLTSNLEEREALAKHYVELINRGVKLDSFQGRKSPNVKDHPRTITNVVECCNKHVEAKALDIHPKTLSQYKSRIRTFSEWLHQNGKLHLAIGGITADIARDFFRYLRETKKYSGKTCNDFKTLLSSIWREYVEDGKIVVNPWKRIKSAPEDTQHLASYPSELTNLIITKLPGFDKQLYIFNQFIFYCGLRPHCELRRMKIKDLDFFEGCLEVRKEIAKGAIGRKQARLVIIPNQLLELLKTEGYHQCDPEFYIFSINDKPGKDPLSPKNLHNRWNAFKRMYNIPAKYKMYGAKHTAGKKLSLMYNSYVTQEYFGHSEPRSTSHYIKNLGIERLRFLKDQYPSFHGDINQ